MSAILGICTRDGSPVEPELIEKMKKAMSCWQPDDHGLRVRGPAALGHIMLWNTSRSTLEHLPCTAGDFTLSFDGRLDNCSELAAELGIDQKQPDQIPDSTFVLAAYRTWGKDCPAHLLGDFAFAIWDRRRKTMFCARDHIGIRPLYYFSDQRYFIFASDLRGLLSLALVPKEPDEYAIACYLHDIEAPDRTLFTGIRPLLPANSVTVDRNKIRFRQYWSIEDCPPVRYRTVEAYVARLRELLGNAVLTRTVSLFPVGAHLSGGLDSSAVAVLAARCLRKKGKKLRTYNWIHPPGPGDDPEDYEWRYSRMVAGQEQLHHSLTELTGEQLARFYALQDIGSNDKQYIWYEQIVRSQAAEQGVRTMLSGWGGDELISHDGSPLHADLFWSGHPFSALTGLWQESRMSGGDLRRFAGRCWRELLQPRLPDRITGRLAGKGRKKWDVLRCLQDGAASRMQEMDPLEKKCPLLNVATQRAALFKMGFLQNRIDSWSASAFADQLEYRYPLLDKRIVEFAMGVPAEIYRHQGQGRYLFRRSVEDLLPPDICRGTAKQEPKRVERLYGLMFDAQNRWRQSTATAPVGTEKLVSQEKIIRYIDETQLHWNSIEQEERLERLLVAHRSIMVWRLEKSFFMGD